MSDDSDRAPIHHAAQQGCTETIHILLDIHEHDPGERDRSGITPLHVASLEGRVDVIRLLIDAYGQPPGVADLGGFTPLHFAALGGHADTVQLLIDEYNEDPGRQARCGTTPLDCAAWGSHGECVSLFTKTYKQLAHERQADCTRFHIAARGYGVDSNMLLVAAYTERLGLTINNGYTPLFSAVDCGHVDSMRFLISCCKYSPCAATKSGMTLQHVAARNGHVRVMKLLVEIYHQDPGVKTRGWTCLHSAALGGHTNMIELLVYTYRQDPSVKDKHGCTPLYIAAECGFVSAMKLLVRAARERRAESLLPALPS